MTRSALACLSALATLPAQAQGITNPAGGGVIPVGILTLLGLPLAGWILYAIVERQASGRIPGRVVLFLLIPIFLLAGFVFISAADHHDGALYLYLELILIMLGSVFLLARGAIGRAAGTAAVIAIVAVLNFFSPKLVDFQERRYVNNQSEFRLVDVSYPGHWREMHLADGRVLLNINPHRQFGGGIRMNARLNAIDSPIAIPVDERDTHPVIVDLFHAVPTRGTWGWTYRPEAFFDWPILGTVRIPRYALERVGTALVLDENRQAPCRYLYEALGEPMPDDQRGGGVTWTREQTIESRSVVSCEQ